MTLTPLLAVERASKRFGAVAALDDVSLEVGAGEFFALLGPSGCGKTTLMRLVAGFERADAGRVLLKGADISNEAPHRRPVNMMFQSYALFPHLNVFDNIAFGLRRQRWAREDVKRRVEELLDIVQLESFGARRTDQLSGGQRQRVALARALAPKPVLLLLDEPLGALDRKLREETQFQLKDIQRRLKTSFIIVTHDQDEALALADRIAVMRAGRIEQIGTPIEIYERPANRFVAGFVGATNLVEGCIEATADGAYFVAPFGRLRREGCALGNGGAAVLSLRPEEIKLAQRSVADGIACVVEDAAFRGETTHVRVKLAGDARLLVSCGRGESFAPGDNVSIVVSSDAGAMFAESSR
ncbi:MAG TPA: ABC transporter ATP-binding protein [Methylocystis sp.]|nr:ABC transporter ATP-binding protein [Methylocystis sp.]